MFFMLWGCTTSTQIDATDLSTPSSQPTAQPEPENSPTVQPESQPSSEPASQPSSEPESQPSTEPEESDIFILEDAPVDIVFENNHLVSQSNIWNYPAPADEGFYFTTMHQTTLTLRKYDLDFNILLEPTPIASDDDLEDLTVQIADHALLRNGDQLYVAFSTSDDKDLYILSTDLYGERLAFYTVITQSNFRTRLKSNKKLS